MSEFTTTYGKCQLLELNPPFGRLDIQFVPEELPKTRTASHANIQVVGRNNDLMQYTGGNDTLNLKLEFYSDDVTNNQVYQKIKFLESLAMNDGGQGEQPNVRIVMGQLFRDDVWTITSVSSKMTHLDTDNGFLPLRATVDVNLKLNPKKNRFIREVRNG